ncbi:thap domain-containing [Holotrichia oblita]|uniref:Thap domain-containing n=1 Tax=Holotrichia oblita TaxID=644536 RepID=A0ACB9SIC0_HOLOL|nr:thap domain-containing [Holotrichia oblita]
MMPKLTKAGFVCAARGCKNKQYLSRESFFLFPKDIVRARIWAIAGRREDLLENLESLHRSHRLCGAHFEAKAFLNDLRNRLQPEAVPTIVPSLEGPSSALQDHNYSFFIPDTFMLSHAVDIESEIGKV